MSLSTRDMAIAQRMLGLYKESERRMLERVEKRLARGITQVGWNERKLLETQLMRRELEREVARLAAATTATSRSMLSLSYWRAAQRVESQLGGALVTRAPSRAILALERSLATGLQGTHVAILRQFDDVYRRVVAEAAAEGVAGVSVRRDVARRILGDFQRRGVTGFIDRSGRRWNLQSYAHMASRTAVAQAHVQGSIDRLLAHNIRLGRIPDAPEECELCRPWEGKIVTLAGRDPSYPSIDDARSAGLFHPNCKHGVVAWIPELEAELRGDSPAAPTPAQASEPAPRLRPQKKAQLPPPEPPAVLPMSQAEFLGGGSNKTFLWTDAKGQKWVLKGVGNDPLQPYPTGELAAQIVNRHMGNFLSMPRSYIRSGDDGAEYLATSWVDGKKTWSQMMDDVDLDELNRLSPIVDDAAVPMRQFDHLVQNADRNPGNWMLDREGNITAIDHDFAFSGHGYMPLVGKGMKRTDEFLPEVQEAAKRALDNWDEMAAELKGVGVEGEALDQFKDRLERAAGL